MIAKAQYMYSVGFDLHEQYGGKIFAVARVTGAPENLGYDGTFYWRSPIYAEMGDGFMLEHPVDISEFREFLHILQGATTPVIGDTFDQLRDLIISRGNTVPAYFLEAKAAPLPLSAIDKHNWLTLCYDWRNRFLLEQEFRKFYVDYFLRELSDDGRLYSECRVKKSSTNPRAPKAKALSPDKVYADCVLVIDTEGLYRCRCGDNSLTLILHLSAVRRSGDISLLRANLTV